MISYPNFYIFVCLVLSVLAKDLKMPSSSLTILAKELGCKINKENVESADGKSSSGGKVEFAQLVLPLTFPVRRKPIKKKL